MSVVYLEDVVPDQVVDNELTGSSSPRKHRVAVQPARKSNGERHPAEPLPFLDTNTAEPDPTGRQHSDVSDDTEDGVFAYIREIARTPRLTPIEEVEYFEQFSEKTERISQLLKEFPPWVLDDVQNRPRCDHEAEPSFTPGRQWSAAEIGAVFEQISAAMTAPQKDWSTENLSKKSAEETLWNQLTAAVEEMVTVREKIVRGNLLLVASIVMQYRCYTASLSLLDLMQEGSIGLMRAVEKFDPRKGCKFGTYAYWWIKQGIQRALSQQSHTIRRPDYIRSTRQSITKTKAQLSRELEREPSIQETALAAGIDEERVAEILQSARRAIPLDSPSFESTDAPLVDMLADESQATPEEELLRRSNRESLEKVLNTLTPREQLVIQLRYGLSDDTEHSLAGIGRRLGVTRERVRQIRDDALGKLRKTPRSQPLKGLL